MRRRQELGDEVDHHRDAERELQDIGAQLMKHISSDEALQLKDKLDSVSHRYQDLENKVPNTNAASVGEDRSGCEGM